MPMKSSLPYVLPVLLLGFLAGQLAPSLLPVAGPTTAAAQRPGQPERTQAPLADLPASSARLPPIPGGLSEEEKRDISIFRRASRSVAFITSIALRRDMFTFDVMQIPQGAGSGFLWDDQGHVVTNYHVISQGSSFQVTLSDHTDWPAALPVRRDATIESTRRSRK